MTINSISSFTSSSGSTGNISELEIRKKLIELGIAPSGNATVDAAKLEEAEANKEQESTAQINKDVEVGEKQPPPPPPLPEQLVSILVQLGIDVEKGDDIDSLILKAADEINKKLDDKNLSEADKAKYEGLKAQLGQLQEQLQTQSPSAMTGATVMANLNKSLFVN